MIVLAFTLVLSAGIVAGFYLGQTAGRWSQESRYEEGWHDAMSYGGTDSDPEP